MKRFNKGSNEYWMLDNGLFVISDGSGWLPGAYENEEAADLAHAIKHLEEYGILGRLQDEANKRCDKCSGTITVADLTKAKSSLGN